MTLTNPWLALTLKTFQLGLEAQTVIALRMLRLASGDIRGQDELNRMIVEKIAAIAEAQMAAAAAIMDGHEDHVVAGKALTVFRKRVRANKRRLSPVVADFPNRIRSRMTFSENGIHPGIQYGAGFFRIVR